MATTSQARHGRACAKSPGKNGYRYREQFGLVIVCNDEPHQVQLYAELQRAGHPGLASALRRQQVWTQVSANLVGSNKARSLASIIKSAERDGWASSRAAGYGGHFRAVQGFRYLGPGFGPAVDQ